MGPLCPRGLGVAVGTHLVLPIPAHGMQNLAFPLDASQEASYLKKTPSINNTQLYPAIRARGKLFALSQTFISIFVSISASLTHADLPYQL